MSLPSRRPARTGGAAPRRPDSRASLGDGGSAARGDAQSAAAPSDPGALVLPLYTPAEAAKLLAVRESWLRSRAAARTVPCTFVGKHLRFSHADVVRIAAAGATAPEPVSRRVPPVRRR